VQLVHKSLRIYPALLSSLGDVSSAQRRKFKNADGILAPDVFERRLERLMRPYGRAACDANRHSRCRIPGKLIGKEAGDTVDTQEGFVEAVEVKYEMGIAGLPGRKLRTFKHPPVKEGLG
jgi:hypothetical protein